MRIILNDAKVTLIVSAMRHTAMQYEDMARGAAMQFNVTAARDYASYARALAAIADELCGELPKSGEFSHVHVKQG